MRGYLVHLDSPWKQIRHVFIVARSEYEMITQFLAGPWCHTEKNVTHSRITWSTATEADWQTWETHRLEELCCECGNHARYKPERAA